VVAVPEWFASRPAPAEYPDARTPNPESRIPNPE
jgi:hypothetical protein